MLGAFIIFFKGKNKEKIISSSLSFAAGVMICVSFFDLIPEAISMLNDNYNLFISIILFLIFFIIGIISSMTIDKKINENYDNNLYKVGVISMLAIILHNLPEGIATFMASSMDKRVGFSLALAISMHNLPEGISIAVPIYYSTKKKSKSFLYTFISAVSEPFGALLAFLFLRNFTNDIFMSLLFSFISGIMIHISFYELLDESLKYKEIKNSSLFFIIGMIFMGISLFLF